jgi:hypothetical protein
MKDSILKIGSNWHIYRSNIVFSENKIWQLRPYFRHGRAQEDNSAAEIGKLNISNNSFRKKKSSTFWGVTPCSLVEVHRLLGGRYASPTSETKSKSSKQPARTRREAASGDLYQTIRRYIPQDNRCALLGNGSVNKFPRQRIRKQSQMNCLVRCFLFGQCKGVVKK